MGEKFSHIALEDIGFVVEIISMTLEALSQVEGGMVDARILGDLSERLDKARDQIAEQVRFYCNDAQIRALSWRYNTDAFKRAMREGELTN